MSSHTESDGEQAIGCLLAVAWLVIGSIIEGFVLMTLWNWFMPLIWVDIPRLTIGTAIGLSLVVTILTLKVPKEDGRGMLEVVRWTIFTSLFMYVCILAFGWVVFSIIS